nr:helix-turn-helix transcriptional regulator [Thermococcus litoralis]
MKAKKNEPTHWEAIRRTIGANIRELRLEKRLSQEALAEKTGLSRNTIVRAEWGRISLTVERLADISTALGYAPSEILGRLPQEIDFQPIKWSGGRSKLGEAEH